jgi:hypothetical protein
MNDLGFLKRIRFLVQSEYNGKVPPKGKGNPPEGFILVPFGSSFSYYTPKG